MAATPSTMVPLGTPAADFDLPVPGDGRIALKDFSGAPALVIVFMCNHCPYVKHVQGELARMAKDYKDRGVRFLGISSNDAVRYPEDSPDQMALEARRAGYIFPYAFDQSQQVARSYKAACTPDFFVFDAKFKLVYRGQLDDSRPGNGVPVTGDDLRKAIESTLAGQPVPEPQKPSIGCNIKWRPGNEPDWV